MNQNFWETTCDVFSDIYAVSKNIGTLPLVMCSTSEKDKYIAPSLEKYQHVYDVVSGAKKVFISHLDNRYVLTAKETFKKPNYNNQYTQDESWFFINGILTSEIAAKVNAKALACIFDRDIHLFYNPTHNPFNDIVRCIASRTFNKPSVMAEIAYHSIIEALYNSRKVVLIAYSQGGIMASHILARLMRDKKHHHLSKKLEMFTFGSAANRLILHEEIEKNAIDIQALPHIEHFANTRDFIAQISVLHYKDRIAGDVFTHDTFGHFLNLHYLSNLVEGNYGTGNQLSSYIKNSLPKELMV